MGQQVAIALRQSMHRVIFTLAQFLPGIVAFALAVIVCTCLGALLALIIRRILGSLRFDERLATRQTPGSIANVSEWSPANSPTLLLARGALWISILGGLAVGVYAFNASVTGTAEVSLFVLPYITHVAGATLLLIMGTLLARFLSRSVLIGAVNAQLQYARFLSLGIKWLVLVLTAAMALDHLQIGGHIVELAFGILFGGIVLTLALAVGLGSRDLVSRSIERSIERPVSPADTFVQRQAPEEPHQSSLRHF